jgi:16S rRNA (adenine1518-N6/adenine1519-N6)-dimethyltransferase
MAALCTPGETRRILEKYGISARKKYGQNFLIDGNIVRNIIAAAGIGRDDCVLEIGPGIGSMTTMLSEAAGRVVCVEIDESLKPVLADTLSGCDNVEIIWKDVLKVGLKEICDRYNGGRPLKCVANLPYYVTTPILMQLLDEKGCFDSITVMVQKEVADRICADPGSREYGALTLAVNYFCRPQSVLNVSPNCFIPRPGVDSTVLFLKAYEEPPVDADEKWLFATIRASFNQRRKTLANGIVNGLTVDGKRIPVSRDCVNGILKEIGLPAAVRGETLSLKEFAALSEKLRESL